MSKITGLLGISQYNFKDNARLLFNMLIPISCTSSVGEYIHNPP